MEENEEERGEGEVKKRRKREDGEGRLREEWKRNGI